MTRSPAPVSDVIAARDNPRTGSFFIQLGIVMVVATFLLMAGMVFYFSTYKRPMTAQALVVVHGDSAHAGTVITILGTDMQPTAKTLSTENDYLVRFPLPPGTYRLRVEVPRRPREEQGIKLGEYQYLGVKLLPLDEPKK